MIHCRALLLQLLATCEYLKHWSNNLQHVLFKNCVIKTSFSLFLYLRNMSIREGKAGRRSDSVWSHFTKRWTDEKHYVVICIHCKQRVSAKVDRLRKHLRKCISCYIIPKPDIEGMEDCPLASSSDPQPIASECPSIDASSSGLSPPWKVENVLIDSKVSECHSSESLGISVLLLQLDESHLLLLLLPPYCLEHTFLPSLS